MDKNGIYKYGIWPPVGYTTYNNLTQGNSMEYEVYFQNPIWKNIPAVKKLVLAMLTPSKEDRPTSAFLLTYYLETPVSPKILQTKQTEPLFKTFLPL